MDSSRPTEAAKSIASPFDQRYVTRAEESHQRDKKQQKTNKSCPSSSFAKIWHACLPCLPAKSAKTTTLDSTEIDLLMRLQHAYAGKMCPAPRLACTRTSAPKRLATDLSLLRGACRARPVRRTCQLGPNYCLYCVEGPNKNHCVLDASPVPGHSQSGGVAQVHRLAVFR